ncbi:MAG: hypothetical protein PVF43_03560 [Candidatus Eiseniibacteriota bacterium]|jgi:hypothetical protein
MRLRRRYPLWSAGIAGLALVLAAGPAAAQLLSNWSIGSGIPAFERLPSARLEGLGGMRVAVADENNEIQLFDFAGNVTGLLSDKPGSHIDFYTGPREWRDATTVDLGDERFRTSPTHFRVNLSPSLSTAFGGSAGYIDADAALLVTPGLRRVYRLPLEDAPNARIENDVFNAGLKSPVFSAHYARELGERLALGARWAYAHESEQKGTTTLYKIEHTSNTHQLELGMAYELIPVGRGGGAVTGLVLGATGHTSRTQIDGTSKDALHSDSLDWERPGVGASVQAIAGLAGGMKAGVDFRYSSFEGQETVDMNWSPLFFLNPTEQPIELQRATFEEGRRFKGMIARWEMLPEGRPLFLGAAFEASQGEYWQLPETTIDSYVEGKILRETAWQATGGASWLFPEGRGLLAGELSYSLADLDQAISRPTLTTPTSTLELGAGAEYFPYLRIGLRGGYRRIAFDGDRDRDAEGLETTTDRMAIGTSFRTPDGMWQIDAGFNYDWVSVDSSDPAVEDGTRSRFTLQVRWLL